MRDVFNPLLPRRQFLRASALAAAASALPVTLRMAAAAATPEIDDGSGA